MAEQTDNITYCNVVTNVVDAVDDRRQSDDLNTIPHAAETMTPSQKRGKSETLSLRLDPKTKFALEFIARVKGQSITTVVERAVKASASDVKIDGTSEGQSWSDFWDASEGVRTLRMIASPNYPTSFEEDELLSFCKSNWEFFYTSATVMNPHKTYLDIIWPNIETYLQIWREKRHSNYWAAGNAMKSALAAANLASPDWPRGSKAKQPKETYDLNDDIPF